MAETNKKLYWGGKTVHQNSDTYWNKYPLKPGDETFDRKTPHVYRSEEKDERRKNKKRKHSSEEPKHKRSHEDKDDDRYREEDEVEERDDDRHKRKKKKRKESAEEPKHKKSHSDRDNDKEDKKNRERIKDKDKGRDRTKDRVKERDRDVDRYDGRYEDRYGDRYEDRYDEDRYDDRYNDRYDDESKDVDSYKKKKKRKNRSSEEPSEKKHDRSRPDKSKSEDKEKGKEKESKETKEKKTPKDVITAEEKKTVDLLTSKTGGAYIPPARLKMMQASITDKTSAAYQRIAWEALKKSIHGLINKASPQNIVTIAREILRENVIRGRGLLCRSILQAQAASTTFTNVFASLLAIINSKFPNIGELLLKRCIIRFKQGFRRNDKPTCLASAIFIAHLVNQCVAHEIIALEVLTLLLETPTNDSVEVAIAFLKECGQKLSTVCKRGLDDIFDLLRNVLHEGSLEKRVQYMIEVMFQVRKDGFKDHPSVPQELDLVEEEDQFTHVISLTEDKLESQDILNVFKFDPDYEENEKKYENLKKEFFGSNDESEGESGSEDESGTDESVDSEAEAEKKQLIIDNTETNLVALRRTIYLTINSSLHFEECAHKLLRMELKPGQEMEMCNMFLDCCAEQRTYEKFFGLLAQRFCQINQIYIAPFEQIFVDSYAIVHRFATNKLRNVAKFFAHLLFTDAISWNVLSTIHLNEEETSSSSRIFIKILFQELSEFMTLAKLNERVKDPTMHVAFEGLFPRDNPKNTRFAINFFTSIGLGGLTNELREHLKTQPKQSNVTKIMEALSTSSSSSSSSSDSDSDSSSSSSSSS